MQYQSSGTTSEGTRTHGNVVITDIHNSETITIPRLTAMTKSAMPRTLHTTRRIWSNYAVTPTIPTHNTLHTAPAGIPKAGCNPACSPEKGYA